MLFPLNFLAPGLPPRAATRIKISLRRSAAPLHVCTSIRIPLIRSLLAMTMGVTTPHILSQIQNPESPFSRATALKALKNELVGHDQKKEDWVKSGIIPALTSVLRGYKDIDRASNEPKPHVNASHGRSDIRTTEDETSLHAIIIVGSIAQGMIRDFARG